jgi:hypothetical protein
MIHKTKAILSIVGLSTSLLISATPTTDNNQSTDVTKEVKRTGGDVTITIPSVPTPIKPIQVTTVGGNAPVKENINKYQLRAMAIHGHRPPVEAKNGEVKSADGKIKVGEIDHSRVSSYLRGKLQSAKSVEKSLKDAGFTILSSSKVDRKGKLVTIVFTNDALTKMADKDNRAFAGTIRVLVNQKDKEIAFNNPLYQSKAFMQDDFDMKVVEGVLNTIRKAFPDLTNCSDKLKFNLLPKYHFMASMPYYQDMIVLAKGASTQALIDSIKKKKRKNIVYTHKISKNRVVLGVKLGKRTSKFINKVGTRNAGLLPYPVVIENGEAKILDPKYYISIMYPELKMSQFMTIATIPDDIEKDTGRLFR